jgi:hypothetical protein
MAGKRNKKLGAIRKNRKGVHKPPRQYREADLMKSAELLDVSQLSNATEIQENIDFEVELQIQKALSQ